jgi:hypothetical protein
MTHSQDFECSVLALNSKCYIHYEQTEREDVAILQQEHSIDGEG